MDCSICNYTTDRKDHFDRHINTSKHSKKHYSYLKQQRLKASEKAKEILAQTPEQILDLNTVSLIIDPLLELKDEPIILKDEPKLKTAHEAFIQINILSKILCQKGKEGRIRSNNIMSEIKGKKTLNIYELNDYVDDIEYEIQRLEDVPIVSNDTYKQVRINSLNPFDEVLVSDQTFF